MSRTSGKEKPPYLVETHTDTSGLREPATYFAVRNSNLPAYKRMCSHPKY